MLPGAKVIPWRAYSNCSDGGRDFELIFPLATGGLLWLLSSEKEPTYVLRVLDVPDTALGLRTPSEQMKDVCPLALALQQ